jgi:hypothetical protein
VTRPRSIDFAFIHFFLKRTEQNHWSKTYMALLAGVSLSLVGPVVITFSFLIVSMSLIASYGFWGSYLIVAAVSLPIMFLVAWRIRGSVLENAIGDGDSIGRGILARMLVIVEIANIGPRLVLWSIDQMRDRRRMGEVNLDRLAEAVAVLSTTDGGIPIARLLKQGETADDLAPLLAVLLFYEIADFSKTGDRVWLSSDARRRILATNVGLSKSR